MTSLTFTSDPPLKATKSLAIPTPGIQPSFEEVATIAAMSATFCGQSVCVLCLTQEILERWMCQLAGHSASITLLDVLSTSRATLKDWTELLGSHDYDITVLHGACSELRARRISVGYVKALIDAVPSGLVMVA
jgi:hypothetical protein